ncbi:16S rRNA (cytosine(1402)-N(4))-methyltransferase [Candidatus Vidania fulgoroideorum]
MIFKKEQINFKKQIKFKKIYNNIIVDFTYGNGYHSNIILKNHKISLFAYEIDKKIKTKSFKNFFFFNKCYTKFINLKTKKILIAIIDLGYNINQIKNFFSYKGKIFLEKFSFLKQNIIEFLNFEKKKKIYNFLKKFENKNISKKISNEIFKERSKKIIKTTAEIKQIIFKVKKLNKRKKKKNNIFSKTFNAIKNYFNNTKKKINKLLNYLVKIIKNKGCIYVLVYNSFESKIINKFYKKKKLFFKYKKKVTNNNNILIILKRNNEQYYSF